MIINNNGKSDARKIINKYNKLGHKFIIKRNLHGTDDCYNREYFCKKCNYRFLLYLQYIDIIGRVRMEISKPNLILIDWFGEEVILDKFKNILTCNEVIIKNIIE